MTANIREKVEGFIKELLSATQTNSIYGREHKLTNEVIERLYLKLSEALSEQEVITIGIIGNEIAFEKEPFYETSKYIESFIFHLKEIKIEKITFLRGMDKKELTGLVDILTMNIKPLEESGGIEKVSGSFGLQNIIFGKIGLEEEQEITEEDINVIAKNNYQEGLDFLKKASDDIANNRPIDVRAARLFVSRIITNLLKNKNSLLILSSIRRHDEYTFEHSINVAIFALVQAEAAGLKQSLLAEMGVAALLHDAGKVALSGDILRKKAKLAQEDIEKIQAHPVNGAKVLLQTPDINTLAAITAFEHHIRYDMKGYPKRLYGKKMNLASMMIAIADVYDALRSNRAYREEMASEKTYEEMVKLRGEYFHPELLDNFFKIVGVYPPGTLVELDNRAIGIVVKESTLDIRRPQVEIIYNSKGEREKSPYIVNLLQKDAGGYNYRWTIVKSVVPSERYEIPEKYL